MRALGALHSSIGSDIDYNLKLMKNAESAADVYSQGDQDYSDDAKGSGVQASCDQCCHFGTSGRIMMHQRGRPALNRGERRISVSEPTNRNFGKPAHIERRRTP
jgi:hypothetical protein